MPLTREEAKVLREHCARAIATAKRLHLSHKNKDVCSQRAINFAFSLTALKDCINQLIVKD